MKKIKSIHFVGIKGVGNTPLAIIAKEAGMRVTGSDIADTFITDDALDQAGIKVSVGFSEDNVKGADLLITTGAHGGFDNPEVVAAKKLNIPVWTQGQAVGEFMKGEIFDRHFEGISIAGSHGKTTSTAMLATVLKEAKLDPSYVIGTGSVLSLGLPGHFGKGKYFLAEADEYSTEPTHDKKVKFLWQHPKIALFTNVEFDHPDLFPNIGAISDAFLQFANMLPLDGVLIAYGDDPQLHTLLKQYKGKVVTFGYSQSNNLRLVRTNVSLEKTFFWLETNGATLGEFALSISGEHNALNATGVIAAALECGLNVKDIQKGLLKYKGSKRRFEYVGKLTSGALLYDDYAHHPTEIKKTLDAFRQSFPKHKIVCIFQPHTYSRTKSLFEEFLHSFSACDTVVLSDIYPSLREEADPSVSSALMVEKMKYIHKDAVFLPKAPDVVEYINHSNYKDNTILITMGAGDIYKISEKLNLQA